jgi:hypothetical protein
MLYTQDVYNMSEIIFKPKDGLLLLLFETTLSSQKSVSDKQMKQWGSKTQINV